MNIIERLLDNTLTLARSNLIATTFNIYSELTGFTYDVDQLRNSYRVFFVAIPKTYLTPTTQLLINKHTQLFTAPEYYSPYLFDLVYDFDWDDNRFTLSFQYNVIDRDAQSILNRTLTYNTFEINPSNTHIYLPILGHKLLTDLHTVQVAQNTLLSQNLLQFVLDRENYYLVDLVSELVVSSTSSITPKVISNPFLTSIPPLIRTPLSNSRLLNSLATYRNKFVYIGSNYTDLYKVVVDDNLYVVFDMLCDIYQVEKQFVNTMYIINKVDMNLFTRDSILTPIFKWVETNSSVINSNVSYKTIITFLFDVIEVDVIVGPVETVILSA